VYYQKEAVSLQGQRSPSPQSLNTGHVTLEHSEWKTGNKFYWFKLTALYQLSCGRRCDTVISQAYKNATSEGERRQIGRFSDGNSNRLPP
jgi:hypothetical protein